MTATPRSGLEIDDFSTEVRPQDDLYRYVNGPWLDRTVIPDDRAVWGGLWVLDDEAEDAVRRIVEDGTDAEPGTDLRKIGDLYAGFLDTARIDEAGAQPIAPALSAIDRIRDIPSFLALVGGLQREGLAELIAFDVEIDPTDVTRSVPFAGQAGLDLPDESYFRLDTHESLRAAFRDHVARLLELAGVVGAEGQADRVLALETELARHHWEKARTRDVLARTNPRSWDELQQLAGVDLAPWRDALAAGRADAFDRLNVSMPSFVEGLGTMLTDERIDDWAAWLRYQVVHRAAPRLAQPIADEDFAFHGARLRGMAVDRERWRRGIAVVEKAMGHAVGRVYVERSFPPAAKQAADELVADLIEAYRRSISSLGWMTAPTRERALRKLEAFSTKIGHPARWRDYTALDVRGDDLIGDVRRAHAFETDRLLAQVGAPVDADEWFMTPQTVNAYYHPPLNEIVFPAAILQYPLFDAARDPAANYGGIGAIIGHEIGHGFDDQGSRFDADGTLRDWWTDDDRAAFERRTAALVGRYDVLVPRGLDPDDTVSGALTLGENIGDLGGLGIAIDAYRARLAREGADPDGPLIDGLTGVQRLLLAWAHAWREKTRPEQARLMLTLDMHAPAEFRCNEIARNLDAFHDAFGTAPGDALWLPVDERISIW